MSLFIVQSMMAPIPINTSIPTHKYIGIANSNIMINISDSIIITPLNRSWTVTTTIKTYKLTIMSSYGAGGFFSANMTFSRFFSFSFNNNHSINFSKRSIFSSIRFNRFQTKLKRLLFKVSSVYIIIAPLKYVLRQVSH